MLKKREVDSSCVAFRLDKVHVPKHYVFLSPLLDSMFFRASVSSSVSSTDKDGFINKLIFFFGGGWLEMRAKAHLQLSLHQESQTLS